MNMSECRSALAPYIAGLIDEKHALGYKYTSGARILKRFDIYWLEHGYDDPSLTADRLAEWVQKTDSEGTGQLRHRILAVRQLSYYLNGLSIPSYMSKRNVQKLMKKYADKARMNHELPKSVSPHTLRRTRGTMLYRDGVPLEAISIMLGHSNTKTTRDHYSSPSFEQMRAIANKKNEAIPDEPQLWPDDEEEMAKILGF